MADPVAVGVQSEAKWPAAKSSRASWSLARAVRVAANGATSPQAEMGRPRRATEPSRLATDAEPLPSFGSSCSSRSSAGPTEALRDELDTAVEEREDRAKHHSKLYEMLARENKSHRNTIESLEHRLNEERCISQRLRAQIADPPIEGEASGADVRSLAVLQEENTTLRKRLETEQNRADRAEHTLARLQRDLSHRRSISKGEVEPGCFELLSGTGLTALVDELREQLQFARQENEILKHQEREVAKLHEWLQIADPDTPAFTPSADESFPDESVDTMLTSKLREAKDVMQSVEHAPALNEPVQSSVSEFAAVVQEVRRLKAREEEMTELHKAGLLEFNTQQTRAAKEREGLEKEVKMSPERSPRSALGHWELIELRDTLVRSESDNERLQRENAEMSINQRDNRRLDSVLRECTELRDMLVRVESDSERLEHENYDFVVLQSENRKLEMDAAEHTELHCLRASEVSTLERQSAARLTELSKFETECQVLRNQNALLASPRNNRHESSIAPSAAAIASWSLEERVKVLHAELQARKEESRQAQLLTERPRNKSAIAPSPVQSCTEGSEPLPQLHAALQSRENVQRKHSEIREQELCELRHEVHALRSDSLLVNPLKEETSALQARVSELQTASRSSEAQLHESLCEAADQLQRMVSVECENQRLEQTLEERVELRSAFAELRAQNAKLAPLEQVVLELQKALEKSESESTALEEELDELRSITTVCDNDEDKHNRLEQQEAVLESLRHSLHTCKLENQRLVPLEEEVASLQEDNRALKEEGSMSQEQVEQLESNERNLMIGLQEQNQAMKAEATSLQDALAHIREDNRRLEHQEEEIKVLRKTVSTVHAENSRLCELEVQIGSLRDIAVSSANAELHSIKEELQQKTREAELQSQELANLRKLQPSWSSPIRAEEPSSCSFPEGLAGCLETPRIGCGGTEQQESPNVSQSRPLRLVGEVLKALDAMQASLPEDLLDQLPAAGPQSCMEQSCVTALHIHIYMRQVVECNRLSGTFMYLFV